MESTVSGLLRRAKRLDPSNNRSEFIAILEKAIEIDPFMAEPYIFLGLFYFKEKEWNLACRELSEGLNLDCTTSNKMELAEQAYVALGKTYRNLNNKEKSLLCFRTLIGLYPNSLISQKLAEQLYGKMNISAEWLSYYKMGCEAFAKNDLDGAERLLEESAKLNDIFPWTQYQMGLIYQQKGEFALASITLLQAIEEERHYLFCNALALACRELGKIDEERKCIAEALSLNNHYAATLIHFMDLALEAGDKDRVYFLSEIIKNQMPDSPYAFQVESILASMDGSAKLTANDTHILDDLPIDIEDVVADLEEFQSSNFEEISIKEIEKAASGNAPKAVLNEDLLSLPPEVISAYESRLSEPVNHEEQILKKISIIPYESEDRTAATIESETPSGKLKLEVSSEESGKLRLEISAEPSGRLSKEYEKLPIIDDSDDILEEEVIEPKVFKQDSSKLRKDIVYDESGKLKLGTATGEPSGKLRRDSLSEKPIMLEKPIISRQEPAIESKYEKTGVISSIQSIINKIDGVHDKNKKFENEIKNEVKSEIRDEFAKLKKEHNDEIAKLTQEFIKMTEQVILSMQRMESALIVKDKEPLKTETPQPTKIEDAPKPTEEIRIELNEKVENSETVEELVNENNAEPIESTDNLESAESKDISEKTETSDGIDTENELNVENQPEDTAELSQDSTQSTEQPVPAVAKSKKQKRKKRK